MSVFYACPCCGCLTLPEKPPGTFEVCPVCFWEDDEVQFKNPTQAGGANSISLAEARVNYRRIGAIASEFLDQVRPPTPEETN